MADSCNCLGMMMQVSPGKNIHGLYKWPDRCDLSRLVKQLSKKKRHALLPVIIFVGVPD